jgi:1-acyl-sn-glycerol-3-phosphate acyltransferase
MEYPTTPPRAYRIITSLLGLLVRIFFREVEYSGLEHVPKRGGGPLLPRSRAS